MILRKLALRAAQVAEAFGLFALYPTLQVEPQHNLIQTPHSCISNASILFSFGSMSIHVYSIFISIPSLKNIVIIIELVTVHILTWT